jgi:hypothetical protein
MFFLVFLLDDRRIREAQKHMDPTDPDRIRIRNTEFYRVMDVN